MINSTTPSNSLTSQSKDTFLFSFFKAPIKNTKPFINIGLHDVFNYLISDRDKQITDNLRTIENDKVAKKYKAKRFDYVTFSGTFSYRENKSLINHSGFICIDMDGLNDIAAIMQRLLANFTPTMVFISPRGKGLKIVFKIDINRENVKESHLQYFIAFEECFKQEMGIEIDPACKDVARACFLPHDPACYFNEEAEILDSSFIAKYRPERKNKEKKNILQSLEIRNNILERAVKMINQAQDGQKHNELLKASRLLGGYIASGATDEREAISVLERAIQNRDIDCFKTAQKTILSGIEHGKMEPLDDLRQYFNNEETDNLPPNIPLTEPVPTPLLPIEGFPKPLQTFINEYQEVYSSPRDFIAAAVILSTALAIGNKLELHTKYKNVPVLWLSIIGPVSSGKTAPLNFALSFFEERDNASFKEYQRSLELYNEESEKKKIERDETIQKPNWYQYILNDYTPEALARVHSINDRGICIYRDELSGWLKDFGRYNKGGEQENMLSSYFGLPMKFNRAGSEPINIERPCIFVTGGIQPDLLPTLADDNRAENGFLSRFCHAYPDEQNKPDYTENKLNPEFKDKLYKYLTVLADLDKVSDLELCNDASKVYANWYDKNARISNAEQNGYLKGVYGKLDVICLRIAIVVHGMNLVYCQNVSTKISAETMATAISITEYFRATALKVYRKIFVEKGAKLVKKDVIKYLDSMGATQNEIKNATKVSQQYVQKILKS
ncbi:MAG: DUF3987 domain-containing protein [Bacteroidota bacterium]|nr:DUF3987 domain-containing protein [Bacteroidota bacterium]